MDFMFIEFVCGLWNPLWNDGDNEVFKALWNRSRPVLASGSIYQDAFMRETVRGAYKKIIFPVTKNAV